MEPVDDEEVKIEVVDEHPSPQPRRRSARVPGKVSNKEARKAAEEGLEEAEGRAKDARAPKKPAPPKEPKVPAEGIISPSPGNHTAVRGVEYLASAAEVAAEVAKEQPEIAALLRKFQEELELYRTKVVDTYRSQFELPVRCFLEVMKELLRYDEAARIAWFGSESNRFDLTSAFHNYMGGGIILDLAGCPEALRRTFWAALQFVYKAFKESVAGWESVSGESQFQFPITFVKHFRDSNLKRLVANDEEVTEKQGRKIFTAVLAMITSEPGFIGDAMREFRLNRKECLELLEYRLATIVARWPMLEEDKPGDDDDDDDDDNNDDDDDDEGEKARLMEDLEERDDPSYKPPQEKEAKVKPKKLALTGEELRQIVSFDKVATDVVKSLAKEVKKAFPGIELPALTARVRREVVFVASNFLSAKVINNRRQFGGVPSTGFGLNDWTLVCMNVVIGGEGAAMQALAIELGKQRVSVVINCSGDEVGNHYAEYPFAPPHYISLPSLKSDADVKNLSDDQWKKIFAVRETDGLILVHSVRGTNRAPAVVFQILQRCYGLKEKEAFDALFKAVPNMEFEGMPLQHLRPAFDSMFASAFENTTFANTTEDVFISYNLGQGGLPVATLAPSSPLTPGGHSSIVDYWIFNCVDYKIPSVLQFFARQLHSALQNVPGPIYLVCYPSSSLGGASKMEPLVKTMCELDSTRFFDGSTILVRRRDGSDGTVESERKTIGCKLPRDHEHATFVLVEQCLQTGSSASIFAEVLSAAGVSADRLKGVALARFKDENGLRRSKFILPQGSPGVSVAAPDDVCIDVPESFKDFADARVIASNKESKIKTLAFATPALAMEAALKWLGAGIPCCPWFEVEDYGYPARLVDQKPQTGQLLRETGRNLFILNQIGNAEGSKRKTAKKKGQKAWAKLSEEERLQWEKKSAKPPTEDEVRTLFHETDLNDNEWEILQTGGGGNCVHIFDKKKFSSALKDPLISKRGYIFVRAFGTTRSQVWIPSSMSSKEALATILALSDTHAIVSLSKRPITEKTLATRDGGVLYVIGEHVQVQCPEIKKSCSPTWSAGMVHLNEATLGLVSFFALKKMRDENVQGLLVTYFQSLERRFSMTHFAKEKGAQAAANKIVGLLRDGVEVKKIMGAVPLLSLFHLSLKDIYRCNVYDDKFCGLSTRGGSVVHLLLHLPLLPWQGNNEQQKTQIKYREAGEVSRKSAPYSQQQAEERIRVLRAIVVYMEQQHAIDPDESLMKGAFTRSDGTLAVAKAKCKTAKELIEQWRQRVLVLMGYAQELPSFENAPDFRGALVRELLEIVDKCAEMNRTLSHVKFSKEATTKKGEAKSTDGLAKSLTDARNGLKEVLDRCRQRINQWKCAEDVVLPDPLSQAEVQSVTPQDAVRSVQGGSPTLVFGCDSGMSDDTVSAIPQEVVQELYRNAAGYNLLSQDASLPPSDGEDTPLKGFNLAKHTIRFQLNGEMAKEARGTKKEEVSMAEYLAIQNLAIRSKCHGALRREGVDVLPPEGRKVAQSLLDLELPTSAPCKFLPSPSTKVSLQRVGSILLHSAILCRVYRAPLYRDASACTRRAQDKLAQEQTNFMEDVTLRYSLDGMTGLMQRVCQEGEENVDVPDELQRMDPASTVLVLEDVIEQCPKDRSKQREFLILKACEVLRALQGSLVEYSKHKMHERIAELRDEWSRRGKDPPTVILCNGAWNRRAPPGRGGRSSGWQRAGHRRATNRNLIRRAKQIAWHQKKKRDGKKSSVTDNFLRSVSIQTKRVFEHRSSKQKLASSSLVTQERIDTRGPPKTRFPALAKDRPWKLRWAKGDNYVFHRDHMASCAIAILGMWERFAFAQNQLQQWIDPSRCVLSRPVVYLYHTDYKKWTEGTLTNNQIQRW